MNRTACCPNSKLVRLNACRFTYSVITDDATGAEKGLYEALHRPGVPGAQPGKSGSPPPHLHNTQTECFKVRRVWSYLPAVQRACVTRYFKGQHTDCLMSHCWSCGRPAEPTRLIALLHRIDRDLHASAGRGC